MRRILLIAAAVAVVVLGVVWRQPRAAGPILHADTRRPGLVCFGDSLTTGAGLGPGEAYPDLLPGLLGLAEDGVVAMGVNGLTLEDARGRARDVAARPEGAVLILLGGNDQLRRRPVEAAMDDLDAIVTQLQAAGKMVILGDFSPLGVGQSGWARGFARVARRRGCLLAASVCDGLYTSGPELLQPDRSHLSAAGQRLLAARLARALAPQWNVDVAALEEHLARLGLTE